MKIKYLFQLLLFSILMISCSRDAEPEKMVKNEILTTKVKTGILYPDLRIQNLAEVNFMFEYDSQKRVTKKNGGFLSISGSTGFNAAFTDKIYTSLLYNNDKVTVEDFYNSKEFTVPKNSKYFTLNSSNLIAEKEVPDRFSSYSYKKEFYSYKNGLLDEIKTTFPNALYEPTDPNDYIETYSERFYYDATGNLTRTEYFELHDGVKTENKRIRQFENYDNSGNPFKRFTLLDEYFYRSLSKNNFRSYREEVYRFDEIISTKTQEWTFNYDANGQIIIN